MSLRCAETGHTWAGASCPAHIQGSTWPLVEVCIFRGFMVALGPLKAGSAKRNFHKESCVEA